MIGVIRAIAVAAAVIAVFVLSTSPTHAHYVYETGDFIAADVKVNVRSEISHGFGDGYSRGDVKVYHKVPPGIWGLYDSPPGYITDRVELWKWYSPDNSTRLCAYVNWQYNQVTTYKLTVKSYWYGPPCGCCWYGTNNGGYRWIGYWLGGWIWSGYHYLPV